MKTRLEPGDLVHAGAGTTLILAYVGLIPGVIPLLALAAVVAALLVLPLVVLGLVAVAVVAPPYGLWRLAGWARRRRGPHGGRRRGPAARRPSHPEQRTPAVRPAPAPPPNVS